MNALPDVQTLGRWIAAIAIAAPVFAAALVVLFHISSRERSRCHKRDQADTRCKAETHDAVGPPPIAPVSIPRG
jgi:hypothetical protein